MSVRQGKPIVWIGGDGPPRGRALDRINLLKHPMQWEPLSEQCVSKLTGVDPLLVVVEADRLTPRLRKILSGLRRLGGSQGFALFLASSAATTRAAELVDGVLVKGRGVGAQLAAAVAALEAAAAFKMPATKNDTPLKRFRRELERLRALVVRDDLTCLYNLRFFNRSLDTEHSRAMRFGRQYSLIFIDLDGLKEVNTRHGHLAGGHVLKQLGEFLNRSLRRIDIPARVGGDEFVVICPETSKLSARILAERLRQGIEALRMHSDGEYPGITASMGVASFPEDGSLPDQVLERADRALYEAKAQGKNTVCCWGDFPSSGGSPKLVGSVHNKRLKDKEAFPATGTPADDATDGNPVID